MSKYFFALFISGLVPLAVSFWPPLHFWKHWPSLVKSIVLIVCIFGVWDIVATYRGHWLFNPSGVWSIRIVNLPIEEVLFFVVIPFCCIFTWETVKYIREKTR